MALFHETCQALGLLHDNGEIFSYIREFPREDQLRWF